MWHSMVVGGYYPVASPHLLLECCCFMAYFKMPSVSFLGWDNSGYIGCPGIISRKELRDLGRWLRW